MLHQLRSQRLAELQRNARVLLKRRSKLDREAKDIERALSITPRDEGIGEFLDRLLAARDASCP